ncbi:MAG: NAD(P)-dependent oxidoreductase [Bacteroidales bacterium]|nr:NAD(P)-dependent oxidoreductase [Bacteroidales bacterium]
MKILVTGASGFVGSFLVERALELGHEVWAGMRASSSKQYLQDERIRFLTLNIESDERLRTQLSEHVGLHGAFDHVIHAAALTKAKDEATFRRTNTDGTLRLARILLATKALRGRFVMVSSLSIMGNVNDAPLLDAAGRPLPGFERYRPLDESDTPRPNTAYGRSKLAAEQGLASIEGLNYIILRPTGVYGPREKDYFLMADSIKKHIDFAVGYEPQALTFIYVRDLVEVCFLALTRGKSGRAYLLSDGHTYDSRAFSDLLQREMGVRGVLHIIAPEWFLRIVCAFNTWLSRLTGSQPTLNNDKFQLLRQRNWKCDIAPAKRELGYTPRWSLEEGVKEAVAWYKQEGWI